MLICQLTEQVLCFLFQRHKFLEKVQSGKHVVNTHAYYRATQLRRDLESNESPLGINQSDVELFSLSEWKTSPLMRHQSPCSPKKAQHHPRLSWEQVGVDVKAHFSADSDSCHYFFQQQVQENNIWTIISSSRCQMQLIGWKPAHYWTQKLLFFKPVW